MPSLSLIYGWRDRAPKGKSCWSLAIVGDLTEITLPSDRTLKRIYNESFREQHRPLEILARLPWGCILRTPQGISQSGKKRFLDSVAGHQSTIIS